MKRLFTSSVCCKCLGKATSSAWDRLLRTEGGIDGWREDCRDVGFEAEGDVFVVVVGGAAVDDDVGGAALGGEERDGSGGIDGKS